MFVAGNLHSRFKILSPQGTKQMNDRGSILDELVLSNDFCKTVHHCYLFTGCQYNAWPDIENIGNYTEQWKDDRWKELSDSSEILKKFSSDGSKL